MIGTDHESGADDKLGTDDDVGADEGMGRNDELWTDEEFQTDDSKDSANDYGERVNRPVRFISFYGFRRQNVLIFK